MPGSNKIAISQRWEEDFQKLVKATAAAYGTSMTQLTTEALKIMIELGKNEKFKQLTEVERRELVVGSARESIEHDLPDKPRFTRINLEGIDQIGLIRDQVEHILRSNPKFEFTTNDVSELLNIPQSTARTYVRDIHESDPKLFVLVKGRPNRIYFNN